VEDAPKVLGHAFISKWAVGARASGGHHGLGLGGGTCEVAGTKKLRAHTYRGYVGIKRGCLVTMLPKHPIIATATAVAVAAARHSPPP